MFYTGQASNPLAARFAADYGYKVTWLSWFVAAIVPGALSLLAVPWVVMKLNPPELKHTPEAAAFAKGELKKMGSMNRSEVIVGLVFTLVCGLWISSSWTKVDITAVALLGGALLLLTGVLSWEDVKSERAAWDVFIWFGGLFRLGQALNDSGVTRAFADMIAHRFSGLGWAGLFAVALVIYYYAHYGFASITAHMVSMFPPFLAVLLAKGAPPGIVVYGFACFANLSACLTHFGTTPGPIFYADGQVADVIGFFLIEGHRESLDVVRRRGDFVRQVLRLGAATANVRVQTLVAGTEAGRLVHLYRGIRSELGLI
jgi:DASS family divalent anion:Na+ symporter